MVKTNKRTRTHWFAWSTVRVLSAPIDRVESNMLAWTFLCRYGAASPPHQSLQEEVGQQTTWPPSLSVTVQYLSVPSTVGARLPVAVNPRKWAYDDRSITHQVGRRYWITDEIDGRRRAAADFAAVATVSVQFYATNWPDNVRTQRISLSRHFSVEPFRSQVQTCCTQSVVRLIGRSGKGIAFSLWWARHTESLLSDHRYTQCALIRLWTSTTRR